MSDQTKTIQVTVTYSIDGFRHRLNRSLSELKELVKDIEDEGHIDHEHLGELKDLVNDLICQSNSFNCVYLADTEDFSNMSDTYLPLIDGEDEA
jgi:transcription initiation factor TFIID subunit TAF12